MCTFLGESFVAVIRIIYYCLESAILGCIPSCLRRKEDLQGKVVVITGSASGLGRCLAEQFANKKCQLALWDIKEAENDEVRESLFDITEKVIAYTVDVRDEKQVYATARMVLEEFGHVDILVNNAGVVGGKLFLESSDEKLRQVMAVNTLAHFWTVKAFLPSMVSLDSGHIVSIASVAAVVGANYLTDYCASKFAAYGFMEALSYELRCLGKKNIRTTVMCPNVLDTPMFAGYKIKYPLLTPQLKADDVAARTVLAVQLNQKIVYLPKIVLLNRILPVKAGWCILDLLGISSSMVNYEGRSS